MATESWTKGHMPSLEASQRDPGCVLKGHFSIWPVGFQEEARGRGSGEWWGWGRCLPRQAGSETGLRRVEWMEPEKQSLVAQAGSGLLMVAGPGLGICRQPDGPSSCRRPQICGKRGRCISREGKEQVMGRKEASGTAQMAVCVPLALQTSPSFSESLLEGADAMGS